MVADEIAKNGGKATHINSFEKIKEFISGNAVKNDVVITMGAGDIFKVGEMLLKN